MYAYKLVSGYHTIRGAELICRRMSISNTVTGLDSGTPNEGHVERSVAAMPSTPPSTPVVTDMTEEVLRTPIYLEFARDGSPQVNMLVEVVLLMSTDGKFVQATATCDEVNPPFPRVGGTRHLSTTSDASIYVPSNIMYAPVYVVVRKIRGLNLEVSGCHSFTHVRLR